MQKPEQKQEHTGSYYAATTRHGTDFPALQGELSVDICIVGAGFTGVASALTLTERGYSVALLEANRVGWGASGRNGGQLIAGLAGEDKLRKRYGEKIEDLLWELRWRGNDIIHDRMETYGIDCDYKPGYMEVASKPRHVEWLAESFAKLESRGHEYEFRLLDRDETVQATGTEAYIGGLLTMRNGHLHPLNLCIGEARAAQSLGARLFEHSPVTRIDHGTRPVVHTEQGRVTADSVILAGNAYHRLEGKTLGGLTFPAGSYIIATEVLDQEVRRRLNPLDVAFCELNEILDYFRLSPDGRMLYGGRCNYSGRDPASIKAAVSPRMYKLYPELRDVKIEYEWGGKIGIMVNRIPLLGRINGNVYYCQGYSGHGVNNTHIYAEILSDAIAGTMERFDLIEQMKHYRIPGGQTFGNQMMALGMLYYRLKDLLS